MSVEAPLVCLITPGHIASTPRLVKNADALAAAGYRVHVVAGRHYPPVDPLDAEVLARARWTHTRVGSQRGAAAVVRKLLRQLCRQRFVRARTPKTELVARAHHAEALRLGATAARVPAQLYFGHCLAGLSAAAHAANLRRARYGFDAEDLHDAETLDSARDLIDRQLPPLLQSRLLPSAAPLLAASPLIAAELERRYGVHPTPVLNTFPLDHAPAAPVDPGPITAQSPARVYWFSQTIGPGRGLEATLGVLARLRTPAALQLRGFVSDQYRAALHAHARQVGFRGPLEFLPPGAPAEMARLAAPAHLGLSSEESQPLNRDLCLTNKIFLYLLAGIPQLLSATRAQTGLAPELGDAALLCSLDRTDETARQLDAFFADPSRMSAARATARRLARERFCWEVEQRTLLRLVADALAQRK